jgi:membrane associated rhomboid family serine protease
MFFFFPYTTDAPIFYWPYATVGLIVANILIFFGMTTGMIPNVDDWVLWYGQGMHPGQWITNIFTHNSFAHLLGNMVFLWVFGIIVEGKLGWWKFLSCYLAMGGIHSALEQMIMLHYTGDVPGAVGASAVIFGLIGMAVVWAPLNEITFFYILMFRFGTYDVSILSMAGFYACMELLWVMLFGGGAGSSILHLTGLLIGLPLGFLLLYRGVVDCEGWDLVHVWRGDYGAFKHVPETKELIKEVETLKQKKHDVQLTSAKTQLREYLKGGNTAAAVVLYRKMKDVGGGIALDRDELLAIVKGLHATSRWSDSAPFMADLIERFPIGMDQVRIKLAHICVVELNRPGKALDLLRGIDLSRLPPAQADLAKKITAKAKQMQEEGVIEFDVDTW